VQADFTTAEKLEMYPFMKWKILKVGAGIGKSLQCVCEVERC